MFIKNVETIFELTVRQNHPYFGRFIGPERTEKIKLYFKTKEQAECYRDTYYPNRDAELQSRLAYEADGQWILLANGVKSTPDSMILDNYGRRSLRFMNLFREVKGADPDRLMDNYVEFELSRQLYQQLKQCKIDSVVGIVAHHSGFSSGGPGPYYINANTAESLSDATNFIYKAEGDEYFIVDLFSHHITLIPAAECLPAQQNIKSLEARLQKLTVEQEKVSLELEKLREEQRTGLTCRA